MKNVTRKGLLKQLFHFSSAAFIAIPLYFSQGAIAEQSVPGRGEPSSSVVAESPASAAGNAVTYEHPMSLLLLGGLPLVWWLRKATPSQPKAYDFPAIRIFENEIKQTEDTPEKTPLWQMLLTMSIFAGGVVGFAEPHTDRTSPLDGNGALLLVVDNGAVSGAHWDIRHDYMERFIRQAGREGREIMFLPTAPPQDNSSLRLYGPMNAEQAQKFSQDLRAQPWLVDRNEAAQAIEQPEFSVGSSIWLSNGLADDHAVLLSDVLQSLGPLRIFEDSIGNEPLVLLQEEAKDSRFAFKVKRARGGPRLTVSVLARSQDGTILKRVETDFTKGDMEAFVDLDLSAEQGKVLSSVSIEGENSAAATVLIDRQWRRRPVGLTVAANTQEAEKSFLLSERFFIEQAMEPYTDLHKGDIATLTQQQSNAVIILTDNTPLDDEKVGMLGAWVENGGTLLRFAGPRLVNHDEVRLLPVPLGKESLRMPLDDDSLGIEIFPEHSPFYGLDVPEGVIVKKKVAPQAGYDMTDHIWASLEDGTPLVTAERRGKGQVVLVHTTANAEWSNLALSGFYIDMMRAVIEQSQGLDDIGDNTVLPAWRVLDGNGRLTEPLNDVSPLTADILKEGSIGPTNPPGFYGDRKVKKAYNFSVAGIELKPLGDTLDGVQHEVYRQEQEPSMKGPLVAGAFILFLLDMLIMKRILFSAGNEGRPKIQQKKINEPPSF